MMKIYLFIEMVRKADARDIAKRLKKLKLDKAKFANVVVLADDKIVAQLDCDDAAAGQKAILEKIAVIEGVVQTNVIAAVTPVKR